MLRPAGAAADEDEAVAVEKHHADAGAVGELVRALCHRHDDFRRAVWS